MGDSSATARLLAVQLARKFLAGESSTIEISRKLSSLTHHCGREVENLFIPFVGVDSETDDLPIGPVRVLWDPNALRIKDVAIERCERMYFDRTLENDSVRTVMTEEH